MGPVLFVSFLAAAAALLFAARGGIAAHRVATGLCLFPAVLVSIVLFFANRDFSPDGKPPAAGGHAAREDRLAQARPGDWRFSLEGFRFPVTPGMAPITIGGSSKDDHLYLPRLPDGFVEITAADSPDGGVQLRIAQHSSRSGDSRRGLAVFSPPPDDARDGDWGGYPLPPKAQLCVAGAGGRTCDARAPAIDVDGACMPKVADYPRLPPPGRMIYPLASAGRPGCAGKPFSWEAGTAPPPALDFVYWCRKGSTPLCVRALESDNLLLVAGDTPAGSAPTPAAPAAIPSVTRLSRGELRLVANEQHGGSGGARLYRYAGERDFDGTAGAEAASSRLSEQRSLRFLLRPVVNGKAVLDIFPDTPEIANVRVPADGRVMLSASASPMNLPRDRTTVGFSLIGGPVAGHLSNLIRVLPPKDPSSATPTLLVESMTGIGSLQPGTAFLLGDETAVKLRMIRLDLPLGWLWVIWPLVLLNAVVRHNLRLPPGAQLVLATLDTLLTLRLLVAFEASLVDAAKAETVAAAWAALLVLPAAFELALPNAARSRATAFVTCLVKAVAVAGGCAVLALADGWYPGIDFARVQQRGLGQSMLVGAMLFGLAWACFRIRWSAVASHLRRLHWESLARAADRSRARFAAWTTRMTAALPAPAVERGAWFARVLAPTAAVALLHLLFVMASVREKLGPVRTTAVIVPLLVLAWAWAAHAVAAAKPPPRWFAVAVCIAGLFAPMGVFFLANDNGAFIYFIALAAFVSRLALPMAHASWAPPVVACAAPVALLFAYLARGGGIAAGESTQTFLYGSVAMAAVVALGLFFWHRRRVARPLWTMPLAAIVGVCAALNVASFIAEREPPRASNAPMSAQEALDAMARANTGTNVIRLFSLVLPHAVEQIGTQDAYRQRVQLEEMREQSASLWGRGWLRTERPVELRDTHVNDTVTAVHLMSPFGRLVAAGIGGFLIALCIALDRLLRDTRTRAASAATLAAIVLATVSIYMLLANTGAVPFTGRNFYFLAVASGSDLVEGGLLVLIMLYAFGLRRGVSPT